MLFAKLRTLLHSGLLGFLGLPGLVLALPGGDSCFLGILGWAMSSWELLGWILGSWALLTWILLLGSILASWGYLGLILVSQGLLSWIFTSRAIWGFVGASCLLTS